MKTTKFFAAAIALLSVISCQNEELQNPATDEGVIVTCTFANNDAATKTILDGNTPKWVAGNEIMLYDSKNKNNHIKLTLYTSGDPSQDKGIIDKDDNTKFKFRTTSGWSEVCAIYPYSACVGGDDFDASNPKLNFAGQDGTFANANICAAKVSGSTMKFYNVGAILKFTKPTAVTEIMIPVAGLVNDYTVSFTGGTPSLAKADATNSRWFNIGSGTDQIYIGVPEGNITKGSHFIYKNSTVGIAVLKSTGNDNTIEKNHIYDLGAITESGTPTSPDGMLSKPFTVGSNGEKVYFSKGNLQAVVDAEGNPTAWKFADNQYDFIGSAVANNSIGDAPGTVDLFGWSVYNDLNKWGLHTTKNNSAYYEGVFRDWTEKAYGVWSTLSQAEWYYLLSTRSKDDSYSYVKAVVHEKQGLIIFPDGYDKSKLPSSISSDDVNTTALFSTSTISDADWSAMQTDGCVFLPAAGRREKWSVPQTNERCFYWTSSNKDDTFAEFLIVSDEYFDFTLPSTLWLGKSAGLSVRLVIKDY